MGRVRHRLVRTRTGVGPNARVRHADRRRTTPGDRADDPHARRRSRRRGALRDHLPYDLIISTATGISTDIDFRSVSDAEMAAALSRRAQAGPAERDIYARPETWYIPSRSHPGENAPSRSIDENGPYWQHYELSYDLIIMHSLADEGQYEKAFKLAAKLLDNATTITDKIAIYCSPAATYGRKGEPDKAIADFTEALRLDPKNGTSLLRPRAHLGRQGRLRKSRCRFHRGPTAGSQRRAPPRCFGMAAGDVH